MISLKVDSKDFSNGIVLQKPHYPCGWIVYTFIIVFVNEFVG